MTGSGDVRVGQQVCHASIRMLVQHLADWRAGLSGLANEGAKPARQHALRRSVTAYDVKSAAQWPIESRAQNSPAANHTRDGPFPLRLHGAEAKDFPGDLRRRPIEPAYGAGLSNGGIADINANDRSFRHVFSDPPGTVFGARQPLT